MQFLNFKTLILIIFLLPLTVAYSESASELKQKIDSHSENIKKLEEEIKTYEKQIETTTNKAKSLQNAVKVLDINQKKITAEIKKTETSIQKSALAIEKLGGEIGNIEEKVESNMKAVGKTVKDMREQDERSLIESFLESKSLAQIFTEYEYAAQFQQKVRDYSIALELYKDELSTKKTATEQEKKNLLSLKSGLNDQHKILDINKKEKNNLLAVTKNKETEYRKILATRQAEKEKFERELFLFESELKRAIDPKSFPSGRKGILKFPLDNVYVTQFFGKTLDSTRLYVSGTHNGVDFRASRGTPVKAVLEGAVQGIGNTDAQRGCYSYGKWILIKHPNGLSSMYAHLDLIKVAEGQNIGTGEIIGYSGETGYATGPHLHFTLYASQGVEIQTYSSSRNCKNVSIPIAGSNAYLDPMLYF